MKNGLLYIFSGGTTSPALTYQDIGLVLASTNPLVLDARGRCPLFFVADGIYRVRLTDADGVVQFDDLQVPSIGASTSGGSGSAVDPTTVFSTGDVKWQPIDGVISGWVRANGRTIGAAASGASERANADCSALFVWLWSNFSDAKCPVSGGRGASGLIDFNANKQITLLDFRDAAPFGLDSMGNAAKGGLLAGNITSGGGDTVNTAGATGGEANHTLLTAELAAHGHAVTDPGHVHQIKSSGGTLGPSAQSIYAVGSGGTTGPTELATTGITIANAGGGSPHNTMPPFMLGSWYSKL